MTMKETNLALIPDYLDFGNLLYSATNVQN